MKFYFVICIPRFNQNSALASFNLKEKLVKTTINNIWWFVLEYTLHLEIMTNKTLKLSLRTNVKI